MNVPEREKLNDNGSEAEITLGFRRGQDPEQLGPMGGGRGVAGGEVRGLGDRTR